MKKLALAAALSLTASTAFAGAPAAPAMEPEVIVENTSSSSGGMIILGLILLAVAAGAIR